ncbi:MAG: alpha-glucosidase C-terminal domain-containing protein [Ignavibacteriaceae bacterium]|nr:alpha-glucosidase C-terminal domain-containing protein [Ignavibacteriaceae bacterium]
MYKCRTYLSVIFFSLLLFTFISFGHNFAPPEWSYDKAIYEVNLRQYTEEGNIKAFEKHLPRLKELGADILWFMPIHPIGEKNRKGTLGSYYSVKDYTAVNPEFGTLDEFKSLVKMIHKMGMYVIIDWVANHTAWDNRWIEEHPDFYIQDSLGNIIPPNPDWTDVADLNYDNKELWKEMIDALKFWVEECDIDGYRCDVAGMVPTQFWIDARTELEKIKNVFMLAEWDTPELHLAFDMTYDWNLHHILNGIAKEEKTVSDLIEHLNKNEKDFPANAFRMQFTSNHDENSWNGTEYERLGDGVEAFAVLTCLIPDMPLVYTGQEAGNTKRLSFFEKDLVEWKDDKLFDIYSKLFELKKNNVALQNGERGGEMIYLKSSDENNVFAFSRSSEKDKVVAVFNLSNKPASVVVSGETLAGSYKNFISGKLESISTKESFALNPWEYRIYIK